MGGLKLLFVVWYFCLVLGTVGSIFSYINSNYKRLDESYSKALRFQGSLYDYIVYGDGGKALIPRSDYYGNSRGESTESAAICIYFEYLPSLQNRGGYNCP